MSLTQRIAHNTIAQMSGKVVSTFLGLIAIAMMTRYLGQEQFGWYTTTITFLGFAGVLIDFGLIPVTAQIMSEPKYDKKILFHNLISYRFVTAFVFFAIVPFIALFFPYPTPVKIAISFSTISFLAIAMNQIFTGFFQQRLKMHYQAIGEIVGRIFLVLGLWLMIQGNAGFLPIMGIVALASVVYMIVMTYYAHREIPIRFAYDREIWRAITVKMWPIALAIMFNVVYLKGDILLLSLFATQIDVGIYGAAYRVIDILAQVSLMIMGIMLPLLAFAWSRNNKEEFFRQYQMAFDALMLLAVPMTIGLIMLATPIMRLVAGDEFAVSGGPLQILAIAVFGLFLGSIFGHTVVAVNRQKHILLVYAVNAILTLTGYLIFIPRYGMYGAAWMTVFSEMFAGLFLFFHVYRYIKKGIALRTFMKILLSGIVMGFTIHLIGHLHVLIIIACAGVVYGVMVMALRVISKDTIKEIIATRGKE